MTMVKTKEQFDGLIREVNDLWDTLFGGCDTDYGRELHEEVLTWMGEGYEEWLNELPCDRDNLRNEILMHINTRFEEFKKSQVVQKG